MPLSSLNSLANNCLAKLITYNQCNLRYSTSCFKNINNTLIDVLLISVVHISEELWLAVTRRIQTIHIKYVDETLWAKPRYWPFVRGIHRWHSPHKCQWRGALMFSLICAWINGWVNNREIADLRRHRAHYDAIVMWSNYTSLDHYSGELFPKLGTKLGKPDRVRVYSVCCIFIQYILLPSTPKSLLCFLQNCRAFCYHCGNQDSNTWDTLGIISAYGPLLQLTYLVIWYIYNMIYIRQAQTKPYQRQITHMGVTVGAYSQLTWEADCHWERSYGIGNRFPEGNDLDMLSIISKD